MWRKQISLSQNGKKEEENISPKVTVTFASYYPRTCGRKTYQISYLYYLYLYLYTINTSHISLNPKKITGQTEKQTCRTTLNMLPHPLKNQLRIVIIIPTTTTTTLKTINPTKAISMRKIKPIKENSGFNIYTQSPPSSRETLQSHRSRRERVEPQKKIKKKKKKKTSQSRCSCVHIRRKG